MLKEIIKQEKIKMNKEELLYSDLDMKEQVFAGKTSEYEYKLIAAHLKQFCVIILSSCFTKQRKRRN